MDFASLIGQVRPQGGPVGPGQADTPANPPAGAEGFFAALVNETVAWTETLPASTETLPNPWKVKLPNTEPPSVDLPSGAPLDAVQGEESELGGSIETQVVTETIGAASETIETPSPDLGVLLPQEAETATPATTPVPADPAVPVELAGQAEPTAQRPDRVDDRQLPETAKGVVESLPPLPAEASDQARVATEAPAPAPLAAELPAPDRTAAVEPQQSEREARSKVQGAPPAEQQRSANTPGDGGGNLTGNSGQDQRGGAQAGTQPSTSAFTNANSIPSAPLETAAAQPGSALALQSAAPPSDFTTALERAEGKPSATPGNQSEQLALRIQTAVRTGQERISVQLHPAELGRIDVQLDIAEDGRLRAAILAERSEALDLLQRDVRLLERALNDAGLKTESGSFSFDLREQSAHDKAFAHGDGRREGEPEDGGHQATDTEVLPRQTSHNGLLDLTV